MNAPAYSGNASAYCVRIIGSDVYVVGFIGRDEQPALWKNGTWVDVALPEGAKDATLWSVYGDGSHVWMGGIVEFARTDDSPYLWCPYLWKDGEPIRLDQTDNSSPEVYDIGGLGGGKIYAVGLDRYLDTSDPKYSPCYWIGTENFRLSNSPGEARSISISGNDVYIAGFCRLPDDYQNYREVAVYWKNGTQTTLKVDGKAKYSEAYGIFVAD